MTLRRILTLSPLGALALLCILTLPFPQPRPAEASSTVSRMSAGSWHSCAVYGGSSAVKCWGLNYWGNLGDNQACGVTCATPANVCSDATCASTLSGVTSIASGSEHTCAVVAGGGVKCWGYNGSGALGDATTTDRSAPVDVCATGSAGCAPNSVAIGDDGGVGSVSVGLDSSMALDGSGYPVVSYYDQTNGNLKVMHCVNVNCSGSNIVPPSPDSVGDVGKSTSLALDGSGFPVVSYYDVTGGTLKLLHCVNANCSSGNVVTVVDSENVGGSTSLALDSSGFPVISYYGDVPYAKALKVAHCQDSNCSSVNFGSSDCCDVGSGSSLALDGAGKPVIAYYDAFNGDLKVMHCNDPDCAGYDESITSPDTTGDVGQNREALTLDGSGFPVVAYYDNTNHHLKVLHCGNANCTASNTISSPDTGVNVGSDTSIRLDSGGRPVISYQDSANQDLKVLHCGNATCTAGNVISSPDTAGSVGSFGTSLRLDSSGLPVVSYWDATNGNLKVLHCGTTTCAAGSPLTGAISVVAGTYHTCALMTGGGVKCWGANDFGQLGNNTTPTASPRPVDVCSTITCSSLLSGAVGIGSAGASSCAITSGSNTLNCWGQNDNGQLGDNTTTNRAYAAPVCADSVCAGNLTGVAYTGGGWLHMCATLSGSGAVKCWGANGVGQLGVGTSTGPQSCGGSACSKAPVSVCANPLCDNVLSGALAAGGGPGGGVHSCAQMSNGTGMCWGDNEWGQLGLGTSSGPDTCSAVACSMTPRTTCADQACSAPLTGLAGGAPGARHGCVVKNGGNVLCSGANDYGEVGDGTSGTNRTFPVPVVGFSSKSLPPTPTPTPGPLTRLAGVSGMPGYNGDEIDATTAQLNLPTGMSEDANYLYIADTNNCRVRQVELAGQHNPAQIHTVAGTGTCGYDAVSGSATATATRLDHPHDVFLFYASGLPFLYIADTENCLIRIDDLTNNMLYDVAGVASSCGSGPGQLNHPYGVAVADSFTFYVADTNNCRIQKVVLFSGVTTVAGTTGTCGYAGDNGPGASAQLNFPTDVDFLAPSANLIIADRDNNRIRAVETTSGGISTIAGTGSAGYSGDGQAAANAKLDHPYAVTALDNHVYVADTGNNAIRHVNTMTGTIRTTRSGLGSPQSLTVHSALAGVTFGQVVPHVVNNCPTCSTDSNDNSPGNFVPTQGCSLGHHAAIDWALPVMFLGLIATRKRIGTFRRWLFALKPGERSRPEGGVA